jgi:hypothetical protein
MQKSEYVQLNRDKATGVNVQHHGSNLTKGLSQAAHP